MTIKDVLKELDIEGKRADVYFACLELGSANVAEIAKKSGIKRTTTYDILTDLKDSGLLYETMKGKKRLFVAEDPTKLRLQLDRKREMLEEILPELQSFHNIKGNKPKIRFYEGKEGLKEVYEDTLINSKKIDSFASDDVVKVLGGEWTKDYLKRRVKKGIYMRAILPATDLINDDFVPLDQEQLRSSKLVNPKSYPFSIEINMYGHQKVALMSAKEETAIIIEGSEIHKTLKLIFQLLWDNLPEIKKK